MVRLHVTFASVSTSELFIAQKVTHLRCIDKDTMLKFNASIDIDTNTEERKRYV